MEGASKRCSGVPVGSRRGICSVPECAHARACVQVRVACVCDCAWVYVWGCVRVCGCGGGIPVVQHVCLCVVVEGGYLLFSMGVCVWLWRGDTCCSAWVTPHTRAGGGLVSSSLPPSPDTLRQAGQTHTGGSLVHTHTHTHHTLVCLITG